MASIKKTIGGHDFAFGTIPPVEALRVEVSLGRVLGEPLFKAAMGVMGPKAKEVTKGDMAAIVAQAIGILTSKLDADELISMMQTVFKYVSGDGERINIDQFFMGKNALLWEVFIEALRVNFADFLEGSLFNSLAERAKALNL